MPEHVEKIVNGHRPSLEQPPMPPNKDLTPFIGLLKKCWAGDPAVRPTFKDIIEELQEIRAKIYLEPYCSVAHQIWCENWAEVDIVSLEGKSFLALLLIV